ncbi:MAG: glycosyltransferase family 2 protein [Candidatus Omnitrophica bacterium]|nr:glycosyltransferase family 2 protein [Candidatus Omnitrophota bacterium]
MNTIFILIPVHNRKKMTLRCIESLQRQTYGTIQIIVCDDGSSDGTADDIRAQYPHVVIVKGNGHLWWTKATNKCLEYVLQNCQDGDYVITVNNDVTVSDIYVHSLLHCAYNNPDALIGSLNMGSDNTVISGGILINWITAKFKYRGQGLTYGELMQLHSPVVEVDALAGRGTLIPVKVFKEIGLYNQKKLPHYGADYEFSIRAKKKGYRLVVNYNSVVTDIKEGKSELSRSREAGLKRMITQLTLFQSPSNLYHRLRFTLLCCPKLLIPLFYVCDTLRVLLHAVRSSTTYLKSTDEE